MAAIKTESLNSRRSQLEAFENTKSGVKGLWDAGITKIPSIFHCHVKPHTNTAATESESSIPIIDLHGSIEEVVDEIRNACRKWGFFQVVNHGIPVEVLEQIINGVRGFHEQDPELKKQFYSRDRTKKVSYFSNFDLFQSKAANWRDTLSFSMAPSLPLPEEIPQICREIVMEYTEQVKKLGLTLFELISKALQLGATHLKDMGCAEGLLMLGHYYPACPEPDLTLGTTNHTDVAFITILLQDQIGGLQVLHDNQWFDVPPLHGALVINVGDFLQIISNDKMVSVSHRVVAKEIGPRTSIASQFRPYMGKDVKNSKLYEPIKELLSEDNPPMYRQVDPKEFIELHFSNGLDECSKLDSFKL